MAPYQERVVAEKNDLEEKLNKLDAFIGSSAFNNLNAFDRHMLTQQSLYMGGYLFTLACRINCFKATGESNG